MPFAYNISVMFVRIIIITHMIRLPGHFVTMLLNVKSSLCSFRIQYTCPFIFNDKHRLYFTSITCMYLNIQMKYSYCMTETLLCSNVHHSRIFTVPKLQVMKASVYGYAICIFTVDKNTIILEEKTPTKTSLTFVKL